MNYFDMPLHRESISSGLTTRIIGRNVLYFASLTSTMDAAREAAQEGCAEGTVVIAGEQTAGRGRLKRSWVAPAGNITLSVILYPRIAQLPEMIMLASLAVVRAIETTTGIIPDIKWPNDVLIHGRKVCGILIETDARPVETSRATFVNIGIGINVNLQPAEYKEIESTATSLSIEAGRPIPKLTVIRALLTAMDKFYLEIAAGKSLFRDWQQRLVTLGKPVTVTAVDAAFDGVAAGVEADGTLLVRCPDGELRKVVAGDVMLR